MRWSTGAYARDSLASQLRLFRTYPFAADRKPDREQFVIERGQEGHWGFSTHWLCTNCGRGGMWTSGNWHGTDPKTGEDRRLAYPRAKHRCIPVEADRYEIPLLGDDGIAGPTDT